VSIGVDRSRVLLGANLEVQEEKGRVGESCAFVFGNVTLRGVVESFRVVGGARGFFDDATLGETSETRCGLLFDGLDDGWRGDGWW